MQDYSKKKIGACEFVLLQDTTNSDTWELERTLCGRMGKFMHKDSKKLYCAHHAYHFPPDKMEPL